MYSSFKDVEISKDITVRQIREEDSIEELTALLNRSYAELSDMGFRYAAAQQDSSITSKRIKNALCLIGIKEDKIIATISFKYPEFSSRNSWYNKGNVSSIGQFAVDPKLQGNGIGNNLLTLVEEYAMENNIDEIALDTAEEAIHLVNKYNKRGYRFIEYVKWSAANYRSVILSKNLKCNRT